MNVTRDSRVTCGVSNRTLPCPALSDPALPGPAHLLLPNPPRLAFHHIVTSVTRGSRVEVVKTDDAH